jgi:hypothetical protein
VHMGNMLIGGGKEILIHEPELPGWL